MDFIKRLGDKNGWCDLTKENGGRSGYVQEW